MDDIREKIFGEVITYDDNVGATLRIRVSGDPSISQEELIQECYRLYKLTDELNIQLKSLEEKNDQENVISELQKEIASLEEDLQTAKNIEDKMNTCKKCEKDYLSKISNLDYKIIQKNMKIEELNDAIKTGFEYLTSR